MTAMFSQRRGHRTPKKGTKRFGLTAFLAISAVAVSHGQTEIPTSAGSQSDSHGNVIAVDQDRRLLPVESGEFTGAVVPNGYGILARQLLANGQTLVPSYGMGLRKPVSPFGPGVTGAALMQQRILSRYGGFRERKLADQPADLASLIARRRALLGAASLKSPLLRQSPDALTSRLETWTVHTSTPLAPLSSSSLVTDRTEHLAPVDALRQSVSRSQTSFRESAWVAFTQGDFRRAARLFESASTLDPNDLEARIGDLVSNMTLGALATARIIARRIAMSLENPFLSEFTVAPKFGNVGELRNVRTQGRIYVERDEVEVETLAAQTLLLWYVGEYDAAERGARRLAGEFPGSDYARWHVTMPVAPQRNRTENGPP